MKKIDKLIINSPYEEPKQFWEYLRDTREFVLQSGRRPAGYIVASESSKTFDDIGLKEIKKRRALFGNQTVVLLTNIVGKRIPIAIGMLLIPSFFYFFNPFFVLSTM